MTAQLAAPSSLVTCRDPSESLDLVLMEGELEASPAAGLLFAASLLPTSRWSENRHAVPPDCRAVRSSCPVTPFPPTYSAPPEAELLSGFAHPRGEVLRPTAWILKARPTASGG